MEKKEILNIKLLQKRFDKLKKENNKGKKNEPSK